MQNSSLSTTVKDAFKREDGKNISIHLLLLEMAQSLIQVTNKVELNSKKLK